MKLPTGKLLALDIGTRRTGVAVTDEKQRVAFSRPELEHQNQSEALEKIKATIQTENIKGIVAGMPLKLDGTSTLQTEKTKKFLSEISKWGIPILEMDERLTTEFAKNLDGHETGDKFVDSRSAQILLENYLASLPQEP